MRSFKFRLESYFKLKVHEEKSAWKEVLKQQGRVYQIEESIHNIQSAITSAREQLSRGHHIGTALLVEESIRGLMTKVQILEKEKAVEGKTLDILRQKYFEKKKDSKILENLKDKKRSDFLAEKRKKDQNLIEEISRMLQVRNKENE